LKNASNVFLNHSREEITTFGIPRFTIRENTERPVTIEKGTNILVGNDRDRILEESFKILNGKGKKGKIPRLWDGRAAERIVNPVVELKNRLN
jgi:UDP-N-acetylglucosamine 2-epimerase (non-hydrolysing)